ncbi:hypothetical protein [Stieleria neptunia]|nr:hypothetical protein [Stieleria neptunia]
MIDFQTVGKTAAGCHLNTIKTLPNVFHTAPDDLHWQSLQI